MQSNGKNYPIVSNLSLDLRESLPESLNSPSGKTQRKGTVAINLESIEDEETSFNQYSP